MDLQLYLHWLHLEPTHLMHYTGYTWSPLTTHLSRVKVWRAVRTIGGTLGLAA
jgi:hypothetical protein